MKLLQDLRVTSDAEVTSRLMASNQEPQHGGQVDEKAEEENGDEEHENGGRNEGSEGRHSRRDAVRILWDKIKLPNRYTRGRREKGNNSQVVFFLNIFCILS